MNLFIYEYEKILLMDFSSSALFVLLNPLDLIILRRSVVVYWSHFLIKS